MATEALISFAVPGGPTLEGRASVGRDNAPWVVILAHPHPRFGGDMDNNVVRLTAHHLHRAGCATLRFNFRGVGGSGGRHDGGDGEQDDLAASVAEARVRFPVSRVCLFGYSFGSWVACRALAERLVSAPAVLASPANALLDYPVIPDAGPVLALAGQKDDLIDQVRLATWADRCGPRVRRVVVADMDHFWIGGESFLAGATQDFLEKLSL